MKKSPQSGLETTYNDWSFFPFNLLPFSNKFMFVRMKRASEWKVALNGEIWHSLHQALDGYKQEKDLTWNLPAAEVLPHLQMATTAIWFLNSYPNHLKKSVFSCSSHVLLSQSQSWNFNRKMLIFFRRKVWQINRKTCMTKTMSKTKCPVEILIMVRH